ncbi:MAG: hypothetical protein JWP91_3398 [Fibrobacteres bacterium]|nr:hypothetical protein [Fibrobacterota bacterium]
MIRIRTAPSLCLTLFLALAASGRVHAQLPAAPIPAYPGDMARNIPVSTSLKWKKVSAAVGYHVQLSADPGFAAQFFEDSTLVDTLASVKRLADTTTYYWRARARSAAGFGPYSKVRSFTTNPPLGAGPTLVEPAESSLGQSLSPTLRWNAFPGAKAYGVQVSLMNNFSVLFFQDTSVADTVLKITGLEKGTLYYWHVRANTVPVKTGWTKGNFTTLTDPPTATASLLAPAEGAAELPLAVEFSWESVERSTGYLLQVSTRADFSAPGKSDSSAFTIVTVDGLSANTTYYWRVRGFSASGQAPFSAARSFRTGTGTAGFRGAEARGSTFMRILAGPGAGGAGSGVKVEFGLARRLPVTIMAYGASGESVEVLAERILEAGTHAFPIPDPASGRTSGIRWIELRAGGTSLVRRIILP